MPVPPRTVHKNVLHIPGRSVQNQPPQQELASDNVHWDSDDWQVWNTSAADCSEVLFLFQMYCGFPALPVSGEVPVLPEHAAPHLPAPLQHQSFSFWYTWTEIPDIVWNPPHRAHPEPAKIFQSRRHPRFPRSCSVEHPHLYFSDCAPSHPAPECRMVLLILLSLYFTCCFVYFTDSLY